MANLFSNILDLNWHSLWKPAITVVAVLFAYAVFSALIKLLKNFLRKRAKKKKELSNIEIFSRAVKYVVFILLVILAIFSYGGSFAGVGLFAGLLTAALGWALQRPITGFAVWVIIAAQRPFHIGDRVIIGDVKGDISNITLTHIHIKEIGGTVASEETSGRIVLIPNAKLLEENVINYTKHDEFILDEVKFSITYQSNIDIAQKTAREAAKVVLKTHLDTNDIKQIYTRTNFQPSGIDVIVRYHTPASRRNEIVSQITQEIFKRVKKIKSLEFAYPHTEVILRK